MLIPVRHRTIGGEQLAEGVVGIGSHLIAVSVHQVCHVALEVCDVGIGDRGRAAISIG